MAVIKLAPEFAEDLDRITDFLLGHEAADIEVRLGGIADALDVLRSNPLIGRADGETLRELVIGRGSRGYVVLYRYEALVDTVFVLAIRAQREAGYARP
ncbi:type II toxin-antitoxin system RelE/ParE family toxin [uncultured Luteimonas sp.]|uniref:type II toxin-antitoxin system RelE/ParE family toxin n=1 Tax=uncultured Luteimonas sp. TaxID=453144 RepID=UPI002629255D|nr:type II toxin-antitoxin system RelE/ParE family toxin [uncultured Luteimonas sp.]